MNLILVLLIILTLLACHYLVYKKIEESFEDSPKASISIIPGPLPKSVSNYLSQTCVATYSEPDLQGPASGCIPPGHHFDGSALELMKSAKSFTVPVGFMVQMYGDRDEFFTTIDSSKVNAWTPPFLIKQFVIFQTDLVESGINVPEPTFDDGKSEDVYADAFAEPVKIS